MILRDTCALLWRAMEPARLSEPARSLIAANAGRLAVSAISAFEIAIKARKKKLELSLPASDWWRTALAHHGVACIPVSAGIALASVALPPHPSDPADRIIIATAAHLSATVLTPDAAFRDYDTKIDW